MAVAPGAPRAPASADAPGVVATSSLAPSAPVVLSVTALTDLKIFIMSNVSLKHEVAFKASHKATKVTRMRAYVETVVAPLRKDRNDLRSGVQVLES